MQVHLRLQKLMLIVSEGREKQRPSTLFAAFPAPAACYPSSPFGSFGDLYTRITSQMDCIAARNQAITISSSTDFFFFMITPALIRTQDHSS